MAASPGAPLGWVDRVVSGYDLEGPRVRLGLLWFAVALAAALLGALAVAVVFGVVAGAAGTQTAAAWRRKGDRANPVVAGLGGLGIPLFAAAGTGAAGLAVLAMAGAAVALAPGVDRRGRPARLVHAAATLRCGLPAALAAGAAVVLSRTDPDALVVLLVLVCAYDVGDYLVGTGAAHPVEGPLAGIAAVVVVTFAVAVFQFPPFDTASAWVFGGLVAVLAPLGRFVGAALAPGPEVSVPALRRLDSWLIVAPVWTVMLWSYLG